MSYTIVQQPDSSNLSSLIKDLIVNSTADITIELLIDNVSILSENYTPDSSGNIYVREIGKLVNLYLAGIGLTVGVQTNIKKNLTFKIGNDTIGTYAVLKCNAYSSVVADYFLAGSVFLHLMKQKKRTTTTSTEYITYYHSQAKSTVICFVTYLNNGVITDSDERYISNHTPTNPRFITFDCSFTVVAALFNEIPADSIIAYRIKRDKEISVFMIDRNPYLLLLQYRFTNSFDVPETILTRGPVIRKGNTSFNTSKIESIDVKYNVIRNDEFTVNSGKIFSLNDYDRFREMFNSESVEIYFQGEWRKIVITEENASVNLRAGNLDPVSFTFHFADSFSGNNITGESFMRWILEGGVWQDGNMWVDTEQWIDNPV